MWAEWGTLSPSVFQAPGVKKETMQILGLFLQDAQGTGAD